MAVDETGRVGPPEPRRVAIETPGTIDVGLHRSTRRVTPEILLWEVIRQSTHLLSFNTYRAFIDLVLCNDVDAVQRLSAELGWGETEVRDFGDQIGTGPPAG